MEIRCNYKIIGKTNSFEGLLDGGDRLAILSL